MQSAGSSSFRRERGGVASASLSSVRACDWLPASLSNASESTRLPGLPPMMISSLLSTCLLESEVANARGTAVALSAGDCRGPLMLTSCDPCDDGNIIAFMRSGVRDCVDVSPELGVSAIRTSEPERFGGFARAADITVEIGVRGRSTLHRSSNAAQMTGAVRYDSRRRVVGRSASPVASVASSNARRRSSRCSGEPDVVDLHSNMSEKTVPSR